MPTINYCLNVIMCGNLAAPNQSLCYECMERENVRQAAKQERRDNAILRIYHRLTQKPSRAAQERKAGLK